MKGLDTFDSKVLFAKVQPRDKPPRKIESDQYTQTNNIHKHMLSHYKTCTQTTMHTCVDTQIADDESGIVKSLYAEVATLFKEHNLLPGL